MRKPKCYSEMLHWFFAPRFRRKTPVQLAGQLGVAVTMYAALVALTAPRSGVRLDHLPNGRSHFDVRRIIRPVRRSFGFIGAVAHVFASVIGVRVLRPSAGGDCGSENKCSMRRCKGEVYRGRVGVASGCRTWCSRRSCSQEADIQRLNGTKRIPSSSRVCIILSRSLYQGVLA
jgi:hypothetical protein